MMMVIGLVLFAAAAAVGIDVAATNSTAVDIDVFGSSVATNTGSLVVGGVVIAFVAAIGALLLVDGNRRRRRISAQAREDRAERERLTATVAEERTARQRAEAERRAVVAGAASREARAEVRGEERVEDRIDLRGDLHDEELRDLPAPPAPR